MPQTGLTIESPRIRQTITFVVTAADSHGEELVLEALLQPGAFVPPHLHLHQEERFEVVAGTGSFNVAGRKAQLGPGERLIVPTRTRHRFANRGSEPVRVRTTLRPALRADELFENLFRLGAEGRVNRLGAPSPLRTARLIREFRDEFFYLAGLPVALQRLLAGAKP